METPEWNVWNLFKVNNKDTREMSVTSFWCLYCLYCNLSHTLLWCFHCWLLKSKCQLVRVSNFRQTQAKQKQRSCTAKTMGRYCNINRVIGILIELYGYNSSYMHMTLSYMHITCSRIENNFKKTSYTWIIVILM